MNRWLRRSLLGAACVLMLGALLSVIGVSMFRSIPDWYAHRTTVPAAQRQQWAQNAENKLIDAQNWAVDLRGDAVRSAHAQETGAARPATRAANSFDVAFSQDELNALFEKWSVLYGWRENYGEFVDDPRIVLRDGRIIIAGKVIDLGAIVSVQLRPSIDEAGRLNLELVKVAGGKLPLPDAVWSSYRDKISAALRKRMNLWRNTARIDPSGAANNAAMSLTMARLYFHVILHEPAEPVLFLPLADRGDSVPVKLRGVQVEDGKLAMTVVPLTVAERSALLQRVRSTE